MKIAVNRCYGGFELSPKAIEYYLSLKGLPCYFYKQTKYKHNAGVNEFTKVSTNEASGWDNCYTIDHGDIISSQIYDDTSGYFYFGNIERNDPLLIQTIEHIGHKESSGPCAAVDIVDIPDGISWEIDEYDGMESIHETHRSW